MKIIFKILQIIFIVLSGTMILLNLYRMYAQIFLFDDYPTIFGIGYHITSDSKELLLTDVQNEYRQGEEIVYAVSHGKIRMEQIAKVQSDGYLLEEEDTVASKEVKGRVILRVAGAGQIVLLMLAVRVVELPMMIRYGKTKTVNHA